MKLIILILLIISYTLIKSNIDVNSIIAQDLSKLERVVETSTQQNPKTVEVEFQDPEFIEIPRVRNAENTLYGDVISRTRKPHLSHKRETNAHETTHQINAEYRNQNIYSYFILPNKITSLPQVHFPKKKVGEKIPNCLRNSRFQFYIMQDTEWRNDPLYILDEWSAYINGAMVAVDDYNNGRSDEHELIKTGNRNNIMIGPLEFSIYSVGLGMIIKEEYPDLWPKYKVLLNYQLKQSVDVFNKGITIPIYAWEHKKYLDDLRNHPDAREIRDFLKQECNGLWLQ